MIRLMGPHPFVHHRGYGPGWKPRNPWVVTCCPEEPGVLLDDEALCYFLLKRANLNHSGNMLRASIRCCQILFLAQVWRVIYGIVDVTTEVVVICNKDALLPCQVVHDPQVVYEEVTWYKVDEKSEERSRVEWKRLQYDAEQNNSRQLNSSSEVSSSQWHSLRITNTTDHDSGTYTCTLESSDRKYNGSKMITLIVKGCPEQLEDAKFKKHRAELVLLCSLGLFYLMLIFFTCCFLKDKGSQELHKSRKRRVTNSLRLYSTYQKNDSNGTGDGKCNLHSPPVDFLQSVKIHQQPSRLKDDMDI